MYSYTYYICHAGATLVLTAHSRLDWCAVCICGANGLYGRILPDLLCVYRQTTRFGLGRANPPILAKSTRVVCVEGKIQIYNHELKKTSGKSCAWLFDFCLAARFACVFPRFCLCNEHGKSNQMETWIKCPFFARTRSKLSADWRATANKTSRGVCGLTTD